MSRIEVTRNAELARRRFEDGVEDDPLGIRLHPQHRLDDEARQELAAATLSVEQIRARIGATSLAFLSESGLQRSLGLARTCLACFNGRYPAGEPQDEHEERTEEELTVFPESTPAP